MIVGVGTDIVEVARLELAARRHGDRFLHRVFTPSELAYCRSQHHAFQSFAARFAAKEAFLKALGTGLRDGISWQDMDIVRDGAGRPDLILAGRALELTTGRGVTRVFVSLAHTADHGMAVVVLERNPQESDS
jgi:holo-[acyl-carrier protein] synthase